MNSDSFRCCGEIPVRSNSKYFGRWMCSTCNQLFDRTFTNGDDSNGDFIVTGMYADRKEQEENKVTARALGIMLGHGDLFKPDIN